MSYSISYHLHSRCLALFFAWQAQYFMQIRPIYIVAKPACRTPTWDLQNRSPGVPLGNRMFGERISIRNVTDLVAPTFPGISSPGLSNRSPGLPLGIRTLCKGSFLRLLIDLAAPVSSNFGFRLLTALLHSILSTAPRSTPLHFTLLLYSSPLHSTHSCKGQKHNLICL